MDTQENARNGTAHTHDHDKYTHDKTNRETRDHETHSHETHAHDIGSRSIGHSHTKSTTKAVINRLSRAIGHLTSVRGMVEQGRDCSEVLIQLAAVRSAINKTCEVIIKDHLEHCIVDAVNTGDMGAIEELNRAVELLMK